MGADGTDTDFNPRYPAVVMVRVPNDKRGFFGVCTGTLISPSHVLTATHCVTVWNRRSPMTVLFGAHPEDFVDVPFSSASTLATRIVTDCHMHPSAAGLLGVESADCAVWAAFQIT